MPHRRFLAPAIAALVTLLALLRVVPPAAAQDAPGLSQLDFRHVIADAKARVFPAVVYIKCLRATMDEGAKESVEVSGSGVVIEPSGVVLTNWHVVDKATDVRCLLSDGLAVNAHVVGTDKSTDLAILQLKLPAHVNAVPHAPLGDSTTLREGDFVMAMGAPWGLNRSVSIGIISCRNRYLPGDSEYSLWLQTDASISPGNSGGPLVNTAGEVIGINSRGAMQGGDLGFAVPTQTIAQLLPELRKGRVDWSWTGLQFQALRDFNRNIYFDAQEGVIVAETDPQSPARLAGIQQRDRIVRIAGVSVTAVTEEDLPALRRQIGLLPKRQPVDVQLVRDGKTLTVSLAPREKGSVEGEELDCPRWDLTVKTINQFDNPDLYFHRQRGVFIFGTREPGNAAAAGLRSQDILLKIEDRDIHCLDDVREAHKAAIDHVSTRYKLRFTLLRNGMPRQVVLDFSRDFKRE